MPKQDSRAYHCKYYADNIDRIRQQKKEWYQNNKQKSKASRERRKESIDNRTRKALYNISAEEFNSLMQSQNEVCAICKNPERIVVKSGRIKNLSVDHCHKSKQVRGLLCNGCNRGLGFFSDDPIRLMEAALYLQRWGK